MHARLLVGFLCLLAATSLYAQGVDRLERGNLISEGIPDLPRRITDRLSQYQNTRSVVSAQWMTHAPGMLVATRFGDTYQLHHVHQPGGARRQLTFFDEPVRQAAVSPNHLVSRFLFTKDIGGSEFYQIFSLDLSTGAHQLLTDGKSRNGGMVWSNQGDRFVYQTTRRNNRDWDLHLADIRQPGTSHPVLEAGGLWTAEDWSGDDARLLVARRVSINESYPHVLELESGKLVPIPTTDDKVALGQASFAKDGSGVYFTSDDGTEFLTLRHYDTDTGSIRDLTSQIPWDIEGFALSEDGRFLAFVANEHGTSRLHVWSLPQLEPIPLPEIPVGVVDHLSFSPEDEQLAMVINSARSPGDAYSVDLQSSSLHRWTYSETGGLNPETLTSPKLIEYVTFDRADDQPRMIPAFYYRPAGTGPHPVVVQIHGGPEGQARPRFSPAIQYLVNELGTAVLEPNVRGSNGYGKEYLLLDNGYRREDSVRDIGHLLDWIQQQPELDSQRVAVLGGSYGGYMVLSSLVHFGDRLRAGIDNVGISNFVTFLESTQDYRRDLRRVEYGDERDPAMRAFLQRISPLTHVHRIRSPLLVAQGFNDPRVPVSESEQMVEAIRRQGGAVWYLLAKDEGHGFQKKANYDHYLASMVLFLEEFLLSR